MHVIPNFHSIFGVSTFLRSEQVILIDNNDLKPITVNSEIIAMCLLL